jgi:uncharacterized protein CbrC (UPF0167 family)
MTEKEKKAYNEFKKNHYRAILLISNDSGIGTTVKVKCLKCGKIKDITDYDSW